MALKQHKHVILPHHIHMLRYYMAYLTKFLLALAASLSMSTSISAQIFVGGNGAPQQCYMSTKLGNPGRIGAIRTCEDALKTVGIGRKDKAATHINLGILLMRKGDNQAAQTHYKHAIDLRPKAAEVYINYAASLIYTGEYQTAITTVNKAIDMDTSKMPEALFNRAMAYNRLQNYTAAYKDLKQALVLKPEWPVALKALENYTVTTRAKTN